MASRNERRKRARQRVEESAQRGSHSERMVAQVVKAAESRQISQPEDDGFLTLYENDRAVRPPFPLDQLLTLYEENAIHSACIDAKVADAVGRGWLLEQEDEDEEVDESDQKAQMRVVRDTLRELARPSGVNGGFTALCRQLLNDYDATGWGIWEITRDGSGPEAPIDGIFPMPPHTLRAIKDDRDLYVQIRNEKKTYFKRFGSKNEYDAKTGLKGDGGDNAATEVLILKHYSSRTPFYGVPPWISGVPAIAEFTAIREYNVSWFSSGGTGDRIVHTKAEDETVAKNLSDSLAGQLKNAKGVGHTTLFSYGTEDTDVDVEQMNPEVGKRDGQFGNRREDLVKELLIGHQVPGYRIGWAIMGALGGEAASEMLDSYRFGVVEPMQESFEELLADSLFNPDMGGIDLGGYAFKFKDLDWSQMAEEVTLVESAVQNGMATPNEARVRLGWERSEDPRLDEFYVGGVPLGQKSGGPVAPEVQDAADVLKQLERALVAAIAFEDVQKGAGATVPDSDDENDRVVEDDVEAAADAEPTPGKKARKKPKWSY